MASYLRYPLGCIHRFQFRARLGSPSHFSIPCHLKPYVRFSHIRLSDHLLPVAFATRAWPSGIVPSEVPGLPRSSQPQQQSPSLRSFRNTMKALPLPSPKVMLSLRSYRCRVGGGTPKGSPPSAAQTQRAVFPHWAFTKVC